MSAKTLAVVIPNYNHGRYLAGALDSVVSQSFQPKEVIVVDDASTDNSVEIIKAFAEKYPFVTLLRNEKNQGMCYTLNRGLERATSDYVSYPGADDEILPGFFEKSMKLLAQHPEAGLCSALSLVQGEKEGKPEPHPTAVISDKECFVAAQDVLPAFKKFGNWIETHSVIYKRSAVLEAGGHHQELAPGADNFLIHVIAAKYGACFIPERLALWRKLDSGYAQTHGADVAADLKMVESLEQWLRRSGLFSEDYVMGLRREALLVMLYELSRRDPYRHDQALMLVRRLPFPTLADKLFMVGMRMHLGLGRLAIKLYLFMRQDLKSQWRIARRKLS